jgi:glycosyltransferase involved in cell wall biosynthesis
VLSLITCTGGRPEAFALLERYILDQNYQKPFEWIIVDDVDPPTIEGPIVPYCHRRYIRPAHKWQPGAHTLTANLIAGAAVATGEKLLFIEDDEIYRPGYLASMEAMLDAHPLAGQAPARYYHVGQRAYKEIANHRHASLCQTGIRRELLSKFLNICRNADPQRPFVDLTLWNGSGAISREFQVVSIKGMPGRGGIGSGHRPAHGYGLDPKLAVLKEWAPEAWHHYERFGARV